MRRAALGIALSGLVALQEPTQHAVKESAVITKQNDSTYNVTYTNQDASIKFRGKIRGNTIELKGCHTIFTIGRASMTFTTILPPINYQVPDTFKVEGYHISKPDERTLSPKDSSYHYSATIADGLQLRGRTLDRGSFSHDFSGYIHAPNDSVPFEWQLRTKLGLRCHKL